jgi:hypothetical protein
VAEMRLASVYVKGVRVSLSRSPLRLKVLLVFTPFRKVRCLIVLIDARTGGARKSERPCCRFPLRLFCSPDSDTRASLPNIYRMCKWICHSLASVALGIRPSRLSTCSQIGAAFDAMSHPLLRWQYVCHWKPGWSCAAVLKTSSNVALGLEKRVGKLLS